MTITVHHIGPTCVQCNQTKLLMDRLAIPYVEVDLRENPHLVEKFKELGHLTAPIVTVSDNQIWSGFKYEFIKALATRKETH